MTFPVRDQYGKEDVLRAKLYHPFVDAVRRLLEQEPDGVQLQQVALAGQQQGQQGQPAMDVDLYRGSDVSLISMTNSPAACGLQGGEPLLLYRYGRCSREYWKQQGQPDRASTSTFAGLYVSDYKNQVSKAMG